MIWHRFTVRRTAIVASLVLMALLVTACEVPEAGVDEPLDQEITGEEMAVEAQDVDITADDLRAEALSVTSADMPAVRLSELIGANVVRPTGDPVGQIGELIVDIESGEWAYVIVQPDEAAGLGEQLLPIPAAILTYAETVDTNAVDEAGADVDLTDTLVVIADSAAIAEAPRLVGDIDTLSVADPLWYTTYYDYWGMFGYPAADPFYPSGVNTYPGSPMAFSALQGRSVFNPADEELATIRDVIFDEGFINYAALDFHENSPAAGITSIVPLYVLIYNYESDRFVLDQDAQMLANMPQVDLEAWPDLVDPDWDAAIVEYWDDLPLLAQTGVRIIPSTSLQASQLFGYEVMNAERETLGEIEDFAIDPQTNRILFAVLSFNGFLDVGEEWFPIPLNELSLSRYYQEFALDVDEELLEAAPSFTTDEISRAVADVELPAVLSEYWGTQPITVTERTILVTSLFDETVVNATGEQLGVIDDVLIDLFDGRVDFYILEFGGFLDIGDTEVAVPAAALTLQEDGALFDVAPAVIENAPEFTDPLEPYTYNPQWETEVESYWNEIEE